MLCTKSVLPAVCGPVSVMIPRLCSGGTSRDVAERAAKMAGITLSKEDYITVVFTDEGLQEPSPDGGIGSEDVRGVGESLVFAIGFLHLLEEQGWTYPALPERFFSPQEFKEFQERSKLESELVEEYNNLAMSQYAE
jgi:hypothetical protein